jgi:hypothetical protein
MLRLISVKTHERPLPAQATNACFLAVAWGRALRLPVSVVVELGGAAIAHPLTVVAEQNKKATENSAEVLARILDELKEVWPLTELQRLTLFEWTKDHGEDGIYNVEGEDAKCYAHFFSRMIRILALFETMTTYRENARVYLPDEALAEMLKRKDWVDPTLLKIFVNWVGVYPIGTLVELQSGEIAQVFAGGSDPLRFQRPVVSILKDSQGQLLDRPALLDLAEVNEKLGVYRKSIRRSLRIEEAKIPQEYFQIEPLHM